MFKRKFFWLLVLFLLLALALFFSRLDEIKDNPLKDFPAISLGRLKNKVVRRVEEVLPPAEKIPLKIDLSDILIAINEKRETKDIVLLVENEALKKAAILKAEEIIEERNWLEEEDRTKTLIEAQGYSYQVVGESDLFLPLFGEEEMIGDWLIDQADLFLEKKYQQIGLASASGEFRDFQGTLLVAVLASPWQPTPTPTLVVISEDELWQALIIYRQTHQKPDLQRNQKLCDYARFRAQELLERLKNLSEDESPLDNHAGFTRDTESGKAFEETGFRVLAENLSFDPPATNATQIIEWGWDTSTPHRESLLDKEMTYGCIAGQQPIYVAILGKQ